MPNNNNNQQLPLAFNICIFYWIRRIEFALIRISFAFALLRLESIPYISDCILTILIGQTGPHENFWLMEIELRPKFHTYMDCPKMAPNCNIRRDEHLKRNISTERPIHIQPQPFRCQTETEENDFFLLISIVVVSLTPISGRRMDVRRTKLGKNNKKNALFTLYTFCDDFTFIAFLLFIFVF